MNGHSLLSEAGLPDSFGVVLLSLALIVLLAPYFSGTDLGVIKIPTVSDAAKRYLKFLGPVVMIAAVLLHVPFLSGTNEQPGALASAGQAPAASRTDCVIAGLVFDSDSNKPLSALSIDVYRDLSAIQQRPAGLKLGAAMTGPDGQFSFDCGWIESAKYPIRLGVEHQDWLARRITGPQIDKPGRLDSIKIPIKMSDVELVPLKDVSVTFGGKETGSAWYVVGDMENKSSHSYPCIRARFDMQTSYQDKMQGDPVQDLGVIDVIVRDLGPNQKKTFEQKLPKQVGFGLQSKQEC